MEKINEKKKRKSSKYICNQRIDLIIELILAGAKRSNILQYITEKENWDVKTRQIENYIRKANDYIQDHSSKNRNKLINKTIAQLEYLYMKSNLQNNYKTSLLALRELINLTNLTELNKNNEAKTDIKITIGGKKKKE